MLQSLVSQRVGYDLAITTTEFTCNFVWVMEVFLSLVHQ